MRRLSDCVGSNLTSASQDWENYSDAMKAGLQLVATAHMDAIRVSSFLSSLRWPADKLFRAAELVLLDVGRVSLSTPFVRH